jgi:hypothetical protein
MSLEDGGKGGEERGADSKYWIFLKGVEVRQIGKDRVTEMEGGKGTTVQPKG